MIHDYIQSFPEIKEECYIELPVKFQVADGVFISGKADIVDKKTGHVWDIKSIKTLTFVYQDPSPEHVEQINCYMVSLGSREGELLYVQKTDLECISHKIVPDMELFEQTKKKVLEVYAQLVLWRDKKIKYCPFEKCSCYFCKTEKLYPEFEGIDDGRQNI